ncbi:hypothetical protein KIH27_04500 [Mycobacterium sp. M1]|uniref:DUF304 domain-containing protein n=1 Tax=Mycolicibacter acidiphilus TaxID=2835306 RepID=A0ABS5REZ4_9MYCO|nr:hypothetical protein [Mycolicibacter acidiphilus]MBS9532847.1 hypothetical protein [Mycolicibacter acidiphilus]
MPDGIICRYIPWYEGNAYIVLLALPLMGVSAMVAGGDPGNPPWLRFVGILLLAVTPFTLISAVSMWRLCILYISPSDLTVRLAKIGSDLIRIQREQVISIIPLTVSNGVGGRSLQVEIAYHPEVAGVDNNEVKKLLIGLQFSVRPINLTNALIAWEDAAIDDPDELLDLIERILQSKSVSDVIPPPSRSALESNADVHDDRSDHE